MILHLFPKSKFLESYVNFVNKYFDMEKHLFVAYTNGASPVPDSLYQVKNVVDYDTKNIIWLLKQSKKADKIIFHNLSVNIYELFMYFLHPGLIRKSIWLVWGGDLYCYRNKREKVIDKFVEFMRRSVIANFPYIATLVAGDFELVKKWYKTNAQNVSLNYVDDKEIQILNNCKKTKKENGAAINVIVGNSATKTNCHKEVLDILVKFKDENIKIYAPLSYGDMSYGDEVAALGKKYFGDKFIAIREYMAYEKYYEMLNNMDVAIFYNDRQQAIGNIMALAYFEKKLYLREGTSMWKEWVIGRGYPFHSVTDILEESFEKFVRCEDADRDLQNRLVMKYYDIEQRIKEWELVFDMKENCN